MEKEFFCDVVNRINSVYEEYARSKGLSYTSLYVLHMIVLKEKCTQKYLAEQMYLPKQTIHSIVSVFVRQGLVKFVEIEEDRRQKGLCLTQKGRAFSAQILPPIEAAERHGLEALTSKEQALLFQFARKYTAAFGQALLRE